MQEQQFLQKVFWILNFFHPKNKGNPDLYHDYGLIMLKVYDKGEFLDVRGVVEFYDFGVVLVENLGGLLMDPFFSSLC